MKLISSSGMTEKCYSEVAANRLLLGVKKTEPPAGIISLGERMRVIIAIDEPIMITQNDTLT